jgi:RimJ/RimL family protein N-acetyltransferase
MSPSKLCVADLKPFGVKGRAGEKKGNGMFARTERLLLRPGWLEDAPALRQAIADEGIVRNLATAPWPYGQADAEAFLGREPKADEASCLIFLRTDAAPALAGGIGFARTPDNELEFGYWVARPYWGRGIATEAGRAVIANARDSLRVRRFVAGHFLDNPASGRVLQKLGFCPTGATRGRFSAGRDAIAPVREFTLELAGADADCADRAMAA